MANEKYKITKTMIGKHSTLKCIFIFLFTNCQLLQHVSSLTY